MHLCKESILNNGIIIHTTLQCEVPQCIFMQIKTFNAAGKAYHNLKFHL